MDAATGITVLGQPTHSPLLGEASERESTTVSGTNDTQGTAQRVGNLLTSDRGTLSVAGTMGTGTDVDWYRVDVNYSDLEAPPTLRNIVAAAFDIDYADGMSRPDLRLSIYDSTGRLVYLSGNSNISEDQPQPLAGSSASDLARGSVGVLDPYAGSVNLPEGAYFVAVSSKSRVPQAVAQFVTRLPANPLLRLEPNTSARGVGRIGPSRQLAPKIQVVTASPFATGRQGICR